MVVGAFFGAPAQAKEKERMKKQWTSCIFWGEEEKEREGN